MQLIRPCALIIYEIEDFRVVKARMEKEKIEQDKQFVEENHLPSDEDLNNKQNNNEQKFVENDKQSQQDFINNFKI